VAGIVVETEQGVSETVTCSTPEHVALTESVVIVVILRIVTAVHGLLKRTEFEYSTGRVEFVLKWMLGFLLAEEIVAAVEKECSEAFGVMAFEQRVNHESEQ